MRPDQIARLVREIDRRRGKTEELISHFAQVYRLRPEDVTEVCRLIWIQNEQGRSVSP